MDEPLCGKVTTINDMASPKNLKIISRLSSVLLKADAQDAWAALHTVLSENYDAFSEALGRNVAEDELNHLLGLLVLIVARNGLRTAGRRENLFNLAEAMGVHFLPVHFYSPVPDVKTLPEITWKRQFDDTPGWNLNVVEQLALLAELSRFAPELTGIPRKPVSADDFSWENPAFNETDASLYYAIIRHFRPRRVVEIGGGYSTMIASRACLQNGDTSLEVIEPYPMDVLTRGMPGLTRLISQPVETIPMSEFEALGRNDVVFVDSTHVSKINSDVNYLLLSVLPRLRSGVLVHFHDIFLPWEYARSWVVDKHIFWNEQYLLLAFLLFNERFEVVLANQYLGLVHPASLSKLFPDLQILGGGSFWIRCK